MPKLDDKNIKSVIKSIPKKGFTAKFWQDHRAAFASGSGVAKALNKYGLSYLHVMDGLGFGFHNLGEAVTCADIRKYFDSAIISNVGLTKEIAEGMVRSGAADLVAFGRLYISNPDLPERFANDWPLAETAGYEHWWGHTGEKGYTDWPTYEEASKKSNKSEAEPEEKKEE